MPTFSTTNVAIKGIVCAVPNNPTTIMDVGKDYFDVQDIEKVSSITGVKALYHAKPEQTASDLCFEAAKKLMGDLGWGSESIDGLIFISQTPDYIMPPTSCILQNRLNLARKCLTLDINLGCSAYVYGLSIANQLIASKVCKRIILLVGDTISKKLSKLDKSVSLIFGDGVSATALEYNEDCAKSTFVLYSDGGGAQHLIIPAGGARSPISEKTKEVSTDEDGNVRSAENLYMNGMEIFSFAIKEVPNVIREVVSLHGWEIADIDKLLLHQANNYMLKFIAKKAGIEMDRVPLNIDRFGNTGGASLPFLICDQLKDEVSEGKLQVVMSGFGVGLSWGAAALTISDVKCMDIIYI